MDEYIQSDILENEKELVTRAKKDEQAFTILYDFYFPKIYRYIFTRIGNHDTTEDLVSQIFLKVFTNLNSYSYQGYSFGAWVYKIATNTLIDYYRRESRKKEVCLNNIKDMPSGNPLPLVEMEIKEKRRKVNVILRQLPYKYQEILYLRFFADKSNKEIAAALKISINNVRVITHRALKQFKENYDKFH